MFNPLQILTDNKQIFADMAKFMSAWTDFMNKLHERLTRFEAAIERIDNKQQAIIEIVSDGHPATVTPELHATVETWAARDPRNGGDHPLRTADLPTVEARP